MVGLQGRPLRSSRDGGSCGTASMVHLLRLLRRDAMKRIALTLVAATLAGTAFAEYPEKPVTIVVPFAAGGPTDKVARDLAEALRKPLGGQAIVIENVGGAGGTLGAT